MNIFNKINLTYLPVVPAAAAVEVFAAATPAGTGTGWTADWRTTAAAGTVGSACVEAAAPAAGSSTACTVSGETCAAAAAAAVVVAVAVVPEPAAAVVVPLPPSSGRLKLTVHPEVGNLKYNTREYEE